jgi:hypothetical protein
VPASQGQLGPSSSAADAGAGTGNVGDPAGSCHADDPQAEIAVRVKTSDGTPVEGAAVSVVELGLSGTTGPDGVHDFGEVAPGSYTASGQKDTFSPSGGSPSSPASQSLPAPAGTSTQFELVLDPGARISVHVQQTDGTAVQGATVSVDGKGWSGVTDASGNFDFGAVAPDAYTITGQKDCFNPAPASQTQNAPASASTQFQLVLDPFEFKIQYKVNGVWKDAPSPLGPLCPGSSADFKAVITSPAGASWPSGCPSWGGDATGTGAETTVTFSSSGARTVFAQCGKQQKLDINVADPNAPITITWDHGYTVDNNPPPATTKERPFVAEYEACADISRNEWHLRLKTIRGGTDMAVHTGGFQTPQPGVNITTEAQGAAAITDMLRRTAPGGAAGGGPGTWNTEAATATHEGWHRDEWVQTSEHYWPDTETAVEKIKVPYDTYENDKGNAITAMRAGAAGADAKITAFKDISYRYWFTLGDSFGDRPYLAGGAVMNTHIDAVRNFGAAQTPPWALPPGSNPGPPVDHCYKPWLPYSP